MQATVGDTSDSGLFQIEVTKPSHHSIVLPEGTVLGTTTHYRLRPSLSPRLAVCTTNNGPPRRRGALSAESAAVPVTGRSPTWWDHEGACTAHRLEPKDVGDYRAAGVGGQLLPPPRTSATTATLAAAQRRRRLPQLLPRPRRAPGPGGNPKPRPIIVKLVRRDKKIALLRAKKDMSKTARWKKVYLEEDLTPLRARLARKLRKDRMHVWTRDGKIFTKPKEGGMETIRALDTPDDFLKVGWSEDRVRESGLYLEI